jgi:hypothetical protein
MCSSGGPPINLGGMTAGCVAQTTFTWGLCSCKDVDVTSSLLVDGYDSTKGPYMPGGLGAGVGADGQLTGSADVNVWGALWTESTAGLPSPGMLDIKQETRINGSASFQQASKFEENAFFNGNVSTSDSVTVTGTLTVPPNATVNGLTYGQLVHAPVNVPTPCDCAPQDLFPIASWVSMASMKNDDALIGITPDVLSGPNGPSRLDLPCGVYYIKGVATNVTIAAHGNTALFIDGNVSSNGSVAFVLDPTAQFDIVINGSLSSQSSLVVGSPNYPALCRMYVGSTTGASFGAGWQIGGNMWVGYGPVTFTAAFTMYGALFADGFTAQDSAAIHFDRAVVTGGLCPPGGSSSSSSSSGGTGCNSCKDCGNQACNNGVCGPCTSSSQCCAPLICLGGTCGLIQ